MLAFLAATVGFYLRLDLGALDALFVALLLLGLPVLSLLQLPVLVKVEIERSRAYVSSAFTIGILACVALVLGALGPGLEAMGLGGAPVGELARTALVLAGAAAAVMAAFHFAAARAGTTESRLLLGLIPRTRPERAVFAGLSVVAGLGEEIAYRGYLLAVLVPAFGDPWTAVAVSSASFGLLHAYQGAHGIVRTGVLGALFAAAFVVTGNLWPAVAVHTVVDLVGGLWLGPRLLRS